MIPSGACSTTSRNKSRLSALDNIVVPTATGPVDQEKEDRLYAARIRKKIFHIQRRVTS